MSLIRLFVITQVAFVCVAVSPPAHSAETWKVVSPNKQVSLSVKAAKKGEGLTYAVSLKGKNDATGINIVVKSLEIDTAKPLSLPFLANGGFVFRVANSYTGR